MPDYDEKSPYVTDIIPHRTLGPPQFDFERLTRFMSYGFIMSPVQFQWFAFLARAFPITKQSATMPAVQRVCFDQLIFAPIGGFSWRGGDSGAVLNSVVGLAAFFTFMTITEGGGRRAVSRKFQEVYLPSLKANFLLWPAVQILNFRVIPLQFQIVIRLILPSITLLTKGHSLSSLPSVSPGRPTYHLPIPRTIRPYPFPPTESSH